MHYLLLHEHLLVYPHPVLCFPEPDIFGVLETILAQNLI